ncbi:MAG: hypothetical protein ABL308_01650 [Oceanicaulis sp.]
MNILKVLGVAAIGFGVTACNDGSLRALNDAMAMSAGYQIEYPDQRDCSGERDDIRVCTQIRNGVASYQMRNQTSEYCTVHLYVEDGSRTRFELRPGQEMTRSLDVYNWTDRWEWVCDPDPDVLNARLEDDGRWYW